MHFVYHHVSELLYSFMPILTEEVSLLLKQRLQKYFLTSLKFFLLVKQSELKPLMNGNMIILLISVMCKVKSKAVM